MSDLPEIDARLKPLYERSTYYERHIDDLHGQIENARRLHGHVLEDIAVLEKVILDYEVETYGEPVGDGGEGRERWGNE